MYFPRRESYFLVLLFSTWKGEEDEVVVTHTAQSCGLHNNRENDQRYIPQIIDCLVPLVDFSLPFLVEKCTHDDLSTMDSWSRVVQSTNLKTTSCGDTIKATVT